MSDKNGLSLWQVVKSVLMSFFGVQKNAIRERDFTHGKPQQFIIVGLLMTIAFVLLMILLVRTILYFAAA